MYINDMKNCVYVFIILVVFGVGTNCGDEGLFHLAPKSHFSRAQTLKSNNNIFRLLDSYSEKVEVREQAKMLKSMKQWLFEVNQYITAGEVAHNSFTSILTTEEVSTLTQKNSSLDWAKAAKMIFAESIRNPFKQGTVTDKFQREDEDFQKIINQENYFKNQAVVKRDMIFLMQDIFTGKVKKGKQLKQRLAGMHKKLLLGENGDTPYFPITLLRMHNGRYDLKELEKIAGTDTNSFSTYEFDRMLFMIDDFLKKDKITRNEMQNVTDIYSRFIRRDGNYGFVNVHYMFHFGNNSLFMNMFNTMLNLKSISSVAHYHFDYKSIVLPSYYNKLFPGFLAADLSLAEVIDSFFQMAIYRNMDEPVFKELFKAFAFRLKWLKHPVDFSYINSNVFEKSA